MSVLSDVTKPDSPESKAPYQKVVDESGLWANAGENSRFLLTPDVWRVSPERELWLKNLGHAIQEMLTGMDQILVKAAADPRLAGHHVWGQFLRASRVGIPDRYREIETVEPGVLPALCKVDLMEATDGRLYVAEIDGHNKHGMGYSTLASRLAAVAEPQGRQFPGIAASVAAWMDTKGHKRLVLLCGEQEVFYLPESRLFAAEMARHGKEVTVVRESDYVKSHASPALMVDLPFLFRSSGLHARLAESYRKGELRFLLPPKPWTSSKALLALVRNDLHDQKIEDILCDHISIGSLDFLREAIPETYLIKGSLSSLPIKSADSFVAKEVISSGTKGTLFAQDSRFKAAVAEACGRKGRMILQREVSNQPRSYRFFTESGDLSTGDGWLQRITVHYAGFAVAGIAVTARQDKRVHGAPDCLKLGAILPCSSLQTGPA